MPLQSKMYEVWGNVLLTVNMRGIKQKSDFSYWLCCSFQIYILKDNWKYGLEFDSPATFTKTSFNDCVF